MPRRRLLLIMLILAILTTFLFMLNSHNTPQSEKLIFLHSFLLVKLITNVMGKHLIINQKTAYILEPSQAQFQVMKCL